MKTETASSIDSIGVGWWDRAKLLLRSPVSQHWQICFLARNSGSSRNRGFTLVELVIVVAILGIVAGMAVLYVSNVRGYAEETVAKAAIRSIADAIRGTAVASGYLADMKCVPGFTYTNLSIHDLLSPSKYPGFACFDPVSKRGWRGPYVTGAPVQNTNGNLTVTDPWGNPIVLQIPPVGDEATCFRYARLVSAGPDGVLQTPLDGPDGRLAGMLVDGTCLARGDDLVLFLNRADVYEEP